MSRINALRIINLNYNNNTIKIDDETYDFASESTLMSLRNGGGKTVLVQMMMAPFVSKRNRDLKERKFKSYFDNNPTYLLTEWQLDDEGGYLLVGMCVRKKPAASDEDSEDELDIFTFVHHYRQKSKYDIYNIPIVEMKNGGRKYIKSYKNFKSELEEARKTLKSPMDIFNLNVSEQSRKYYQKLREYKINNKEWDIIHKINLKESGLSELFSDAKNVDGLVEKWFLPTVEDKLNKTSNRITSFRELVKKYIFQYREIKSKIEKKDTIEQFCNSLESIINETENLNNSEIKFEKQKNVISNFINYLDNLNIQLDTEINELKNKADEIKSQIDDLKYQEMSKEWHDKDEELDKINNLINELLDEQSTLDQEKINLEKLLHIYECAELNEEYKDKHKKLRELESALENLNKSEEEKAPLRNDLGYTLKVYYENELKLLNKKLNEVSQIIEYKSNEIKGCKELGSNLSTQRNDALKTLATLEVAIKGFEKEEETFEQKTKIRLSKNILGIYEDDFFEKTEGSINTDITETENKKIAAEKDIDAKNELINIKNKEQQDLVVKQEQLINLYNTLLLTKSKYDDEIALRNSIVRILSMPSEDIYKRDLLIENLQNKIDSLRNKGNELLIEKNRIENEKTKLERGIFTEVPSKLKEKFDELDIEFIYGMDWINRNNRSNEENKELIKNNPILPYSLIISEENIIKIQKTNIDEFVLNPIPIIKRSSIDKGFPAVSNLLKFNDILFYISFDKRLVNKVDLELILKEHEAEINKLNEKISINEKDIKDYEEKLYKVKETSVDIKTYNEIISRIDSTDKEKEDVKNKLIKNESILKQAKAIISNNEEKIKSYIEELSKLNKTLEYFIVLKNNYTNFLSNKEKLKVVENHYKEKENKIQSNNDAIDKLISRLSDENLHLNNIKNEIISKEKESIKYNQFKEGNIIEREFEVLKSDYDSLTNKLTNDRLFTEKMKNDAYIEFTNIENKLLSKKEEYDLTEADFIEIVYDEFKYKEIKNNYKYNDELLKKLNKEIHGYEKESIAILEAQKNILERINEKFNLDYPKDKDLILNIKFKDEIRIKIQEKEHVEKLCKNKESDKNTIVRNIDRLEQFKDFLITEEINIDVKITNIENYKTEIVSQLNVIEAEVKRNKNNVVSNFDKIYANIKFQAEPMCNSSLETIKDCIENTKSFLEQLNIVLLSCQTIIEKLQIDIEYIFKEEEEVLTILFDYVKEINENLEMIDDNSSVNIEGKSIKMLKIKLPDWDLNKDRYKESLKFILQKLRDEALKKLSENEAVEEIISKNISINYLYNNIVGISNIEIKLYKIEETRQSEISWNNVSTNSGGEGFLSAFVILSSLLNYMRKDETDIFSSNKDSKVLVMDNPFAQTNAEHLLKPLISIAEKSNTQLICFSGLGGDSIYNRFNNIYVLETVQSRLNTNQQYLKHTHEKGEDFINKLHSTRFKIEEIPVEQITLF